MMTATLDAAICPVTGNEFTPVGPKHVEAETQHLFLMSGMLYLKDGNEEDGDWEPLGIAGGFRAQRMLPRWIPGIEDELEYLEGCHQELERAGA